MISALQMHGGEQRADDERSERREREHHVRNLERAVDGHDTPPSNDSYSSAAPIRGGDLRFDGESIGTALRTPIGSGPDFEDSFVPCVR
jgi:hypothetical protein